MFKKTEVEIELSNHQDQLAKLYKQATGKIIIWVKNGKPRLLNPDEVIIIE